TSISAAPALPCLARDPLLGGQLGLRGWRRSLDVYATRAIRDPRSRRRDDFPTMKAGLDRGRGSGPRCGCRTSEVATPAPLALRAMTGSPQRVPEPPLERHPA